VDDTTYLLVEVSASYLVRLLLEALAATLLLVWCMRRLSSGPWAGAGAVGAAAWAVVGWLGFAANAWIRIDQSSSTLLTWTSEHGTALDWLRVLGVVGAVVALTVGRRVPLAGRP
jgi:hypothetical protein